MQSATKREAVTSSVQNNPVTTVVAAGGVIALVGLLLGWDEHTVSVVTAGTIGAAVLVRTAVYWWTNRKTSK